MLIIFLYINSNFGCKGSENREKCKEKIGFSFNILHYLLLTILFNHTIGIIEAQFTGFAQIGHALRRLVGMEINESTVIIGLRDVSVNLQGATEIIECPMIVVPDGIETASIII